MTFDCGMIDEDANSCPEEFDSLVEVHRHRHEEHGEWLPPFAREDDE